MFKEMFIEAFNTKDVQRLIRSYVPAILDNMVKYNKNFKNAETLLNMLEEEPESIKSLQVFLSNVFVYTSSESNANYKNFVKYLPANYDKEALFGNGSSNIYEEPYFAMNDSKKYTAYKQGIQDWSKKYGRKIDVSKRIK